MNKLITFTKCLAVMTVLTSVGAQAQLKGYDYFGGRYLSADRWDFNNPWNTVSATRELKRGALHGSLRSYGGTDRSDGSAGAGNYIYIDQSRADIGGWETTLNLDAARVGGCPVADSYLTNARMRMYSSWFNDANISGDNEAGKVIGQIHTRYREGDPRGTVTVSFSIFRCDDSNCSQSTDLTPPGVDNFLGRTRLGSTVVMGQSFNPNRKEMYFWAKLPGQTKVRRTASLADRNLNIVDSDPRGRHALQFRNFVANCNRADVTGRYIRPFSIFNGRWQRVRVSATPTRG